MSFHLSAWSIQRPVPILLFSLIFFVVGLLAFFHLEIDDDPNLDIPAVMVYVQQQGAGAVDLETQVTQKVEDAVAGLGNIDKITSQVQDEQSVTTIEFILGTDGDRATNEVRNAVAQIRSSLPQNISEPVINRLEATQDTIMTYVVTSSTRSVEELSDLADRTISRALLSVPGVAQVNRRGGVDREVRVELNPARLLASGITVSQVNEQIRALNVNLPAGRANVGSREQHVRSMGSAQTIEQLRQYRLTLPTGATLPLSALGTVEAGFAEPRQAANFNGEPVVTIAVQRSSGTSVVTVDKGVRQAVEQLQATLPSDVQLNLVFTLANFTRATYRDTLDAILLGCLLTLLTVGLFLRNWQATLITTLTLPLSILPTFIVMQALGYTLNSMTLLGLALAVGNLVDDAICVIENIDSHLKMGKPPRQAALDGAREISLAIVATTAVIVAVFLPVAFMGGIPGQFFQPFGITVAVSTLFSTLIACTVTPTLSAYLLPSPSQSAPPLSLAPYRTLLSGALHHRLPTLLLAVILFLLSLQLLPLLPRGLLGGGNSNYSLAVIELPPGSRLSDTQAVMQEVSQGLQTHPAVESVLATAYTVDSSNLLINLVPPQQRPVSRQQFEAQMRSQFANIPGARVSFRSQGVSGEKDVSILLRSDHPLALTQTATALEQQMRQIPGLVEVASSTAQVRPELVIQPHLDRATDLGVSVAAIARTMAVALLGDTAVNLPQFDLPDRQIPIRIQLNSDARRDLETLKQLRIERQTGGFVPLQAVADIRFGSGAATIDRIDRQRQVTAAANLQGLSLGEALAQINALPVLQNLPPEVTNQPAGDAEIMQDVFTRFVIVLGLAVLSIYAILVLLYQHFFYPLIILVAIPLSMIGAIFALMLTQNELGLFALIGIVLLMALVTKNAILLVDFALVGLRQGMPPLKAATQAGLARLRPILMTSLTTLAGMTPIAFGWGAAGDTRSPMAIAVMGGLSTSTLLTLIIVPVLFIEVQQRMQWMRQWRRRML